MEQTSWGSSADPKLAAAQISTIDERVRRLQELLVRAPAHLLATYHERLQMSWIYHDSALEGTIYEPTEMSIALQNLPVPDPAMVPIVDEIRQYKTAIDVVKELNEKKRSTISLDVVKDLYAALAPEEAEGKGPPKYRKDMPLHRLYFHDIATPDKISYKMRQLIDWVNSPETKRATHPTRLAAKTHAHLLQIYPFPKHSGRVARLLMQLILLRNGYPPAIIHSTERQRYYEALKQSTNAVASIVYEALLSSVETGVRFFEEMLPPVPVREGRRSKHT